MSGFLSFGGPVGGKAVAFEPKVGDLIWKIEEKDVRNERFLGIDGRTHSRLSVFKEDMTCIWNNLH